VLAAAAGAALLAAGLVANPAYASDPPTINQARSDFDGDLGTLLVTVTAPRGVDSIFAELTTFAGEQVATTGDFVLRSGTPEAGTWATTQPFLLESLGNYRVNVEVTDNEGNHVRRDNAGILQYAVRTSIEHAGLDRPAVTYEDRDITLSGVLTGRWPGTGEIRPLAGRRVFVEVFFDVVTTFTAEDGSFSGTVTIAGPIHFVRGSYPSDNNHPFFLPSQTDVFDVAIDPRPTRLRIKTKPERVNLGETTTITGELTWKTPEGWEPIPGVTVGSLFCGTFTCSTNIDRPVTDANGRFEVTHEPLQTGHYRFSYRAEDPFFFGPDPFVAEASAEADIAVLQPAGFSDFVAERDEEGRVVAAGHMQFDSFTPVTIPVEIEFSRGGVAGWRPVGTALAEWDGSGHAFSLETDWSGSGHWRAVFRGVRDHFQSAVSPTVFVP
jgi:hypothetical protein